MNHCRRKHIRCRLILAGFKIKSEVKKNAIFQLVSILSAPKMDVPFPAMSLWRGSQFLEGENSHRHRHWHSARRRRGVRPL